MKKVILITILTLLALPSFVFAKEVDLAKQLSGRILLQVESYGRAWYVDPVTLKRYYLKDGNTAYEIMRNMSLGITNADLNKIPATKSQRGDAKLINQLKGRILLQVQEHGEAWYVNPVDGLRYYLADGQAAYDLMRKFSLGITNENLKTIPMNSTQIVHDTCFDDVAYVKFDGVNFSGGYNAEQILPLASLSKLMTALVLLEQNPNWNKSITITEDVIAYPKLYVGNDPTSEIDLAAGDTMTFYDLWLAMLIASSNQAAAALVDSTGVARGEFVQLMNNKAKGLGLTKTVFYDVAGLDAHNVTTAKEMATIAYQAFSKDEISQAGENKDYTIAAVTTDNSTKDIKVLDRNYSLGKYQPQAAKTGYLVEAQRTVAIKKNDDVVVVMHARSMAERNSAIEKLLGQ